MSDLLSTIEGRKRSEITHAKKLTPQAALERRSAEAPPPRGFLTAIEQRLSTGAPALIAEVKKASPSRGIIRADFDPSALARGYHAGGATCLSVLTDEPFFQGSLRDLAEARAATELPVLRKDFLFDPYQVLEARAWGADCVLLILAAIDDSLALELEAAALALGMDVLVEVHNREELERAGRLRSRLIGINNRDLTTFTTTLTTSEALAPHAPSGSVVVSESGISTPADIARLARFGIATFLVGESLMRAPNVALATQNLLAPVPTEPPSAAVPVP